MYYMYEGDTTDAEGGLIDKSKKDEFPVVDTGLDRQVLTPEVNYNYVNLSVMFTRGNTYARWKFIGQKRDAGGNTVGRRTENPILDTCEYCVEFDGGEFSKLASNLIAESMDAACDGSGNEY